MILLVNAGDTEGALWVHTAMGNLLRGATELASQESPLGVPKRMRDTG